MIFKKGKPVKMKKIVLLLLTVSTLLLPGCTTDYTAKFTEIGDHLFEVEEYTDLDYDAADEFYAEANDNWEGGCSAISKMVDGHRLVGRNMDLNISNKCAYVVRTNAGKYRTVGIAYTSRDYSPDLETIKEEGFTREFYKLLPFMCDDVVNDGGLHIEINMRHSECWPNGDDKYACQGTNPDSDQRVYMFELPRYIAENCATVEEAKDYVKTLDVYSKNHYWNYCFVISDSQGSSSLLEFASNEVYWLDEDKLDSYTWLKERYNPRAIGQANFYLNQEAWITQDIKSGEGRFITLQNGIEAVKSKKDMYDLMKKVQFSAFYLDYDECKENYFDPRSENLGEVSFAVYEVVMNPEFEDTFRKVFNEMNEETNKLTRQEKMDANKYWESIFTEVVDVNAQEIYVRLYENEAQLYKITLDETKKINTIQ